MENKQTVPAVSRLGDSLFFQAATLIALTLFWVGYGFALWRGDSSNLSGYSLLILAFSLFNDRLLFTGEKARWGWLNVLAKVHGVLFLVWVALTVAMLIFK